MGEEKFDCDEFDSFLASLTEQEWLALYKVDEGKVLKQLKYCIVGNFWKAKFAERSFEG